MPRPGRAPRTPPQDDRGDAGASRQAARTVAPSCSTRPRLHAARALLSIACLSQCG